MQQERNRIEGKYFAGKCDKQNTGMDFQQSESCHRKCKWYCHNEKRQRRKEVTITAKAADGSGKKAVYTITGMKGVVKKVTIYGKKTVKAGKSIKLKAKVKATKKANTRLFLEKQQSKICYGEKRKSKGKEKCKRKESEDHRNGNGWKRKEEICND